MRFERPNYTPKTNPERPNEVEGEINSKQIQEDVLPAMIAELDYLENMNIPEYTAQNEAPVAEISGQISGMHKGKSEQAREDVEIQANYQGNYVELLFSRMHDPEIRKQLLDLLEHNEEWIAAHPPQRYELQRDPTTNEVLSDDFGLPLFHSVPDTYTPKTREELETELEAGLETEMFFTPINYSKTFTESGSNHEDLKGDDSSPLNRNMQMGMKRNDYSIALSLDEIRDRSMTEAHEKGHVLRHLKGSEYLEQLYAKAFDVSTINPDVFARSSDRPEGITDEEIIEEAKDYLFKFYRPSEIIERMSQLKNYFGFHGSERFTSAHLHHAQKHYLADGHMDNNMQTFLDAVTPATEEVFIELMNSTGV